MSEHRDPFLRPAYLEYEMGNGTARMPVDQFLNLLNDPPRGMADALAGDPEQTADHLNAVINGALKRVAEALMMAALVHKRFDHAPAAALGTITDYLNEARSIAEQAID